MSNTSRKQVPPDYTDNSGRIIGFLVIVLFILYFLVNQFYTKPEKNKMLRQTLVSKNDFVVKDVQIDGTTKVTFQEMESLSFKFPLIKPISVGQTFSIVTSSYEGKPQVALCEAQPVEKIGEVGKSRTPVVVVNSVCYPVLPSAELPAFEKVSIYELTEASPVNWRSTATQAWLNSFR